MGHSRKSAHLRGMSTLTEKAASKSVAGGALVCSFGALLRSWLEIGASLMVWENWAWGRIMRESFLVAAVVAPLQFANAATTPARAGNGDVAAGLIGGLAAGTIIGAAVSAPRYYAPPPPVYAAPAPYCYWTHGEPVWDGYRGVWTYPSVRVCE